MYFLIFVSILIALLGFCCILFLLDICSNFGNKSSTTIKTLPTIKGLLGGEFMLLTIMTYILLIMFARMNYETLIKYL